MKTVRIPLKTARLIVEAFVAYVPPSNCCFYGHETLEAAIAKTERASSAKSRLAKPKRAKKATRAEETAAIRAEVMFRAGGKCEFCRNVRDLELDHFFGRGKAPQSIENCWALCRQCHHEKTRSIPSAAAWFSDFVAHCDAHGFSAERRRAMDRLRFVEARSALGGAR